MTAIPYMALGITLFSSVLALGKRPNHIADKIFAIFLLSIVYPMLVEFALTLPFFGLQEAQQPFMLAMARDFMPLTLGPFMTLYVESLSYVDYQMTKRRLYHFLPYFVFLVIAGIFQQDIMFSAHDRVSGQFNLLQFSYLIVLPLSLVYYSGRIHILLKQHRQRVLDYFGQSPNRITLMWLAWLVYLFFAFFVLLHLIKILILLELFQFHPGFQTFFEACFAPFLYVLCYFGVKQSQVFHEPFDGSDEDEHGKSSENEPEGPETEAKKAKISGRPFVLADDQLEAYLVRLELFVKSEKPYLNSDLTLGDLAVSLDMPKHHLTRTLNLKLHKNFFNYVNECRIEEFKALIQDPQNSSQTIMTLAFQVGFNSKSAFNNFFKKSTQMTPSEFKKTCLKA